MSGADMTKVKMFESLTDMSLATGEYANDNYNVALHSAIRSVHRAVEALAMFSNDYPYSESIFNECKALTRKLEDMESKAMAGMYKE